MLLRSTLFHRRSLPSGQLRQQGVEQAAAAHEFVDEDEDGSAAAAALFAQDLPAAIINPSKAAAAAALSESVPVARLDRFNSLTKGNASDGFRHSR